jgi:signal transduction histidine kinase
MLTTFADQVAIAVHNIQLLQRTNAELEEKMREEQALRREIERMRSNELAEVAQALVHRLGHAGDVPMHIDATRTTAAALSTTPADAAERAEIERHLTHVAKRFQQINDLLPVLANVARLKEVTLTPLDLRQVVDQALDRLNRSDGIAMHWQPPQAAIPVEGDAPLLQEAIFLLLENACEAMPEGGFLTVRLQREEAGAVQLYVTDTGPGVPTAIRARVFEPGFSTRTGGEARVRRGQGLFVCRAILRRHGGDASLYESATDTGATFVCRLPVLSANS